MKLNSPPIVIIKVLAVFAVMMMAPEARALDSGGGGSEGSGASGSAAAGGGQAASGSLASFCPSCQQCSADAEDTKEECTNIDQQLLNCNAQMAAALGLAQGEVTGSQINLLTAALGPGAACLTDITNRITQCTGVVGKCDANCGSAVTQLTSASTNAATAASAGYFLPVYQGHAATCEVGKVTIAQLESAKAQLVSQNSQLIQAIALLGPSVLELLMTTLGSKGAGDLCAVLKRDLGAEHSSTKAACGPKSDGVEISKRKPGDEGDDTHPGPGGGDTQQNLGLNLESQDYGGGGHSSKSRDSKVREQSVQASSSGGGPIMGSGGSASSGPTSRYQGNAPGAQGFNANIMGDPQGSSAGRRGTASQGQRGQSQWLQGQANARAQAEAHKRAAEAEAARRRELRGPHAQGLFESVSEAYRRYQHEMMQ